MTDTTEYPHAAFWRYFGNTLFTFSKIVACSTAVVAAYDNLYLHHVAKNEALEVIAKNPWQEGAKREIVITQKDSLTNHKEIVTLIAYDWTDASHTTTTAIHNRCRTIDEITLTYTKANQTFTQKYTRLSLTCTL